MHHSFFHPDNEARRVQFEAAISNHKINPENFKEDNLDAAWRKKDEKKDEQKKKSD